MNPRPVRPEQIISSSAVDPVTSNDTPARNRRRSRRPSIVDSSLRQSSTSPNELSPEHKVEQVKSSNTPSLTRMADRPTLEECHFVTQVLSKLHPQVIIDNNKRRKQLLLRSQQQSEISERPANKRSRQSLETPITDAIISTMLSQNTTDANQRRAFSTLKDNFPEWDQVANMTDTTLIEHSIQVAGLAKTRAQRIQDMLRLIQTERGEANFEYLQSFPTSEEIVRELSRFKGMGPKTISCVLLFALGRSDFPVDTHVLRIAKRLGWVTPSSTRESAYEHFKTRVPPECMMDLHCLLVEHGKVCFRCAANGRPQFPTGNWECPLLGIKNGTLDFGGEERTRLVEKRGRLNVKLESI